MGRTPPPQQVSSADLLSQLVQVTGTAQAQIAAALAGSGLAESLAGVLWALNPQQAPVSMRELARRLRCDPSNVTLLSSKLEQAGLVEREPHPTDGRIRVLALTQRGIDLWTELVDHLEATSPIFTLSPDEQRQLSALLAKIQAASPR
ncbi:MarR family winged helix-turn-helix transcriptional regulator [Nonomuraea lactucae]|uniref:MarR family winged helix-turn-helix transcriptional regulator n=1 Tax=Nonomuraea lactucae TaxID=2249762 RepID=UPI000DE45346|nr:MarR family transcriptional regulator [Nonomuraea lactucae]